jgi:hypothetical protein
MALGVVVLAFVTAFVGIAAIRTNALGAGHLYDRAVAKLDRFLAGPVPDRSAPVTVRFRKQKRSQDLIPTDRSVGRAVGLCDGVRSSPAHPVSYRPPHPCRRLHGWPSTSTSYNHRGLRP